MELKSMLKNNFYIYVLYHFFRYELPYHILPSHLYDKLIISRKFKRVFGYRINFKNPQTLNEKIQWLKLNSHEDLHTICADKYKVREWLSQRFGSDYLVPLLYKTENWQDINPDIIPSDTHCIIKSNGGCGDYCIIRDKSKVNWAELKQKCRIWLNTNYYYEKQEWQYKNIKKCIIIEKLLETKNHCLPNDYKLHFINGELEFVYCSINRETTNNRNVYDANWQPLPFSWVAKEKDIKNLRGPEIPPPATFEKMKYIGREIAKLFKYVRVDFYDVDGKLYYGEITLHHGSGFDVFNPNDYDLFYGQKLIL